MLIQTCNRYKINFIDFTYFDSAELYKKIMDRKHTDSLDTVSTEVCEMEKRKKHSSADDALRVYEILKKLCENESLSISELFNKYKMAPRKYSNYNPYKTIDYKDNTLHNMANNKLFKKMLGKTKVKKSSTFPYSGLNYMFNISYRMNHFRELLYIIKLAGSRGMTYTVSSSKCDMFIVEKDDEKSGLYKEILGLIEKGKDIKIILLDDFLNIICFSSERVDNYFHKIIARRPFLSVVNDSNQLQEEINNQNED